MSQKSQKRTKKKGGRNKNKNRRTKKNKKMNKKLSLPRPLTLALKPSHTLEFTSTERQLVDAVNKLIKLLPTLFPKEFFNKRLLPSSAADQLRLMQTVINNVKSPKFLKGFAQTKLLTGQKGGGPGRFFKSPLFIVATAFTFFACLSGNATATKLNHDSNVSTTIKSTRSDLNALTFIPSATSESPMPISTTCDVFAKVNETSVDSIPIEEGAVVISVYETGLEEAGGSMENIFSFGVESVESSTNLTKISTIVTHATQNVGKKLSSLLNPVANVLRDLLKMNNTVVKAKVAEAKEVPEPVATAPVATAPVATAPVATAPVATAPIPELDDDGDFFDADEDLMHTAAEVAPAPVELAPVALAPAPVELAPAPVALAPVALAPAPVELAPAPVDLAPVALAPETLVPEPAPGTLVPAPGTLVPAPALAPVALAPVALAPVALAPVALAPVALAPVALAKVEPAPAPAPAKPKPLSFKRVSPKRISAPSLKADLIKGLGLGLLVKKGLTKKKSLPKKSASATRKSASAKKKSVPKKPTSTRLAAFVTTPKMITASPKMLTAKRKTAITRKKTPRPLHPLLARKQPSFYVESRKSAQARKLRERKMFGYIRRLSTAEQYKNEQEQERKRRGY